jgi:putative protease
MKKPELLAPAGDLERLKVAFEYGADAVYIGGKAFSMRAKAANFEPWEIEAGVEYAHSRGKKVYVALNICAHNMDFDDLDKGLRHLENTGVDAVLVSDPGVFVLARQAAPGLDIHISTQANITNYGTARFWRDLGARRVVVARELSVTEIAEIHRHVPDLEIEAFVHGAMCMAHSGRCLISNFLNARDANRGECSQPCRFSYAPLSIELAEEKTGEKFPVIEDERGTYFFNSKDLCMVSHIPDLVNAGVESLKIEGRMKTAYYVGAVTKMYRTDIDDYFRDSAYYLSRLGFYEKEKKKIGSRGYTTGFFFGKMTENDHDYAGENQVTAQDYLASITAYDEAAGTAFIEQRNKFQRGDRVEILRARGENFSQTVDFMTDENGTEISSAPHPKQKIYLKIDKPVARFDMVRRCL